MDHLLDVLFKEPFKWKKVPIFVFLDLLLYFYLQENIVKWTSLPSFFSSKFFIISFSFSLFLIYLILCYYHTRLPRAPENTLAVLFVIDTANTQLYEDAKYRLVNSFEEFISKSNSPTFRAICVPKDSLKKYNLKDDNSKISLLIKVRCTFMILVKYDADNYLNADNYQMTIRCGVRHPKFSSSKSQIFMDDIDALRPSMRKKNFSKAQTMDVFNFTSQTLSFVCQYIIGLVYLLSDKVDEAQSLLLTLYQQLDYASLNKSDYITNELNTLMRLTKKRLYLAFHTNALLCLDNFEDTKNTSKLHDAELLLNNALSLFPDSPQANINMAYISIALYGDSKKAREYVSKGKVAQIDTSFDDAFLNAYDGAPPSLIISSYKRAFANDKSSNIVKLVDFCEHIIGKEPYRFSLHLALGLQYEFLGDYTLMQDHFATYLSHLETIPPNIQRMLKAKFKLLPTN